jgi:hypothetical protein
LKGIGTGIADLLSLVLVPVLTFMLGKTFETQKV